MGSKILKNTPILSELVDDTVSVYGDVWNIIKNKKGRKSAEVNTLVLASLLDHRLITIESAKRLVDANKIIITDKEILDKYDENNSFLDYLKEKYIPDKKGK